MRIDWRSLLSEIRVDWRDRGPNCSAGNVNICCRKCNDSRFHLGIAEEKEAYYCFREPNRHSGRSFVSLLVGLGLDRSEATRLLSKYQRLDAPRTPDPDKRASPDRLQKLWAWFAPASDNPACMDYLGSRGFPNPSIVAARYDLRFAPAGTWARRILLPVKIADQLITWTGRAVRSDTVPKYLTQSGHTPAYVPNSSTLGKQVLVVVEGPMDALKLAVACERSPYIVAALAGKQIPAAKQLQLRELAKNCDRALIALDADVSISSCYGIINTLASSLRLNYIDRLRLPHGVKDPAELSLGEVLPWLESARTTTSRPRA